MKQIIIGSLHAPVHDAVIVVGYITDTWYSVQPCPWRYVNAEVNEEEAENNFSP